MEREGGSDGPASEYRSEPTTAVNASGGKADRTVQAETRVNHQYRRGVSRPKPIRPQRLPLLTSRDVSLILSGTSVLHQSP